MTVPNTLPIPLYLKGIISVLGLFIYAQFSRNITMAQNEGYVCISIIAFLKGPIYSQAICTAEAVLEERAVGG